MTKCSSGSVCLVDTCRVSFVFVPFDFFHVVVLQRADPVGRSFTFEPEVESKLRSPSGETRAWSGLPEDFFGRCEVFVLYSKIKETIRENSFQSLTVLCFMFFRDSQNHNLLFIYQLHTQLGPV